MGIKKGSGMCGDNTVRGHLNGMMHAMKYFVKNMKRLYMMQTSFTPADG